jgi:rubredoxin
VLQTYDPDECCEIHKAIESGELDDKDSWECPHCGTEWKAVIKLVLGDVKHWSPIPRAEFI